jgi:hypothetical protein
VKHKRSLPCSQERASGLYTESRESNSRPNALLKIHLYLHQCLLGGFFYSGFPTNIFFCIRFSSPAYATCITHHESPRYAVIYSFLLLHPSYAQIFSSALFSNTVNVCSSYSLTFSILQLCPLKTKYFPQNFVLKRPQSLFFP